MSESKKFISTRQTKRIENCVVLIISKEGCNTFTRLQPHITHIFIFQQISCNFCAVVICTNCADEYSSWVLSVGEKKWSSFGLFSTRKFVALNQSSNYGFYIVHIEKKQKNEGCLINQKSWCPKTCPESHTFHWRLSKDEIKWRNIFNWATRFWYFYSLSLVW